MSLLPDFLIFILSTLGFGLLSVSMERHARQVFGAPSGKRSRLVCTLCGWAALGLALLPALDAYGISIGLAVWVGFLAVAATLVALTLTYRPRVLRPLCTGIPVVVVVVVLVIFMGTP
ncbi:hypothetical protein AGMMS50225_11280 [Betaproteobacteria bacterium]|nr:hypothetical protein AGMMS50225_11280 [Betaproteobacteria bacterium]